MNTSGEAYIDFKMRILEREIQRINARGLHPADLPVLAQASRELYSAAITKEINSKSIKIYPITVLNILSEILNIVKSTYLEEYTMERIEDIQRIIYLPD